MIGERSWHDSLDFVAQRFPFPVVSDAGTAQKANAHLQVPARAVDALDGPMDVCPLDSLRLLALASAMDLEDELREASSFWAVLRYLGAFDTKGKNEYLTLSEPGDRVRGNQRRLLSEDLGVAFGLVVASAWIRRGLPEGTPVWVADVDNLGSPFDSLTDTTTSRPDYVLVAQPVEDLPVRMGLVECKGTSRSSNVQQRLAMACAQVASSGRREGLPSLAVSGVFSRGRTEIRTLEVDTGPARISASDPRVREVRRAALIGLGLFGGNLDGARLLEEQRVTSIRGTDRDAARRSRLGRSRVRQSRPDLDSNGVTSVLSLPQGAIDVHQGVDREVDARITAADPDTPVAPRGRRERQMLDAAAVPRGGGVRISEGLDGSTLEVTVR